MRVLGVRREPERGAPDGVDTVVGLDRLPWVLAESDVLVLAAPHTPDTDRLLDRAAIAAMRRGSVLVNVARGQLVDEDALVEALLRGHLRGAVLDVTTKEPLPADHPLWTAPNVLLTPHTAGFRADHFDAVIELFADNLARFERGAPLVNVVDPVAGY
jgi:phosphoglycerate dehydrogenase-like enzyme